MIFPFEVEGQPEGGERAGRAFAEAVAINLATARNLRILSIPEDMHAMREGLVEQANAASRRGAGRLVRGSVRRGLARPRRQ